MTGDLVVDASVLAKTVLPEAESETVNSTLRAASATGARVLAPRLVRYDLGSVLLRRARESGKSAVDIEEALARALGLVGHPLEEPPAAQLAVRHGITYYDASYLALALAERARLWTFDARLAKAAGAERCAYRPR